MSRRSHEEGELGHGRSCRRCMVQEPGGSSKEKLECGLPTTRCGPRRCIGMKPTGSAKKTSRSKSSSTRRAKSKRTDHVVCIKSGGYVDLEPLKIYQVRPDSAARAQGLLRVLDDSGED